MKKVLALVALSSLPCLAVAAFDPAHAFDEVKLELPTVSLTAFAQQDPLTVLNDKVISFQRPEPARSTTSHLVSNMPIIAPKESIDTSMPVKIPDVSRDYTLMIKTPGMEPAK